jgi:hypothetical protein
MVSGHAPDFVDAVGHYNKRRDKRIGRDDGVGSESKMMESSGV